MPRNMRTDEVARPTRAPTMDLTLYSGVLVWKMTTLLAGARERDTLFCRHVMRWGKGVQRITAVSGSAAPKPGQGTGLQ